ncbi:MAG: hypothetical protein DSY90_04350 [Deltaproteobacteria bacterium]|nr:MAG: hypothetical protein DSY90_04350 [Deltaproteobacteria bacterium]
MAFSKSGSNPAERRRYRRVDRRVPVDMHLESLGYDITGETQNLSLVGTYCKVDRPIPEMTQLMMVLNLPSDQVECEGTVVRSIPDPSSSNSHHLAIFFNEISESAKQKLNTFIEA